MPNEWKIGESLLRFEEPDVMIMRAAGETTGDDMRAFAQRCREVAAERGLTYVLMDLSRSKGLTKEARKAANEFESSEAFHAMIFFGTSFAMRALVNMMMRASQLVGSKQATQLVLEDEASARAWIEDHRKRTAAKAV